MNDETLPTAESTVPEATSTVPTETIAYEDVDGALTGDTTYEDLTGADQEATEETFAFVSVQDLETACSNLMHVDLFGSFLICGTLVGLMLVRNRYDH